ncbi:capsular glucan synthase [mine drainage metagenome]|uniref:Capsular glucan synthase n=1 Tax=mine drainage metagenome TaxID=410659 RepID=A0A1J5PML4_9ZZZZ
MNANWAGTVHHGVAADIYEFHPTSEGYLAFLGRISPEKRPDRAIEIARRLGKRLRIAAKVDAADQRYFADVIEPLIRAAGPRVEFIGEIGDGQKSAFLGGAEALLFPIDWPEPFGLVMIEAMACGTPVVAYACGSVPEVIEEGVTGFIVRTDDEACAAVARIGELDRGLVRQRFDARYSATAMARRYLALYSRLDQAASPAHPAAGPLAEMPIALTGEALSCPRPGLGLIGLDLAATA